MLQKLKHWLPILSRFLGGQAVIQIVNLATALLLLRVLPLSEYALFVAANLFISLGATGSDLHLSTAFNTFGARLSGDKTALSRLFSSVLYLRRWLYLAAVAIILTVTPFVLWGHGWPLTLIIIMLAIIFVTVWSQQAVSLRSQVLNIYQDNSGVFQTGFSSAITRLVLTYILCVSLPFAVVALLVNLFAIHISNLITRKKCLQYILEKTEHSKADEAELKAFIYPLVPSAIYFALQAQIGLLVLSIMGEANSIAEVGALGRFAQIFAFLTLLNGFVFQPIFARELNKARFIKKTISITLILTFGFSLVLLSAYLAPDIWLLLLGNNYKTLQAEVPIALAGAIVTFFAGFFYTLLAARAFTRHQTWNVVFTLLTQIYFIGLVGLVTTHNVLVFNLVTGLIPLLVQVFLLVTMLIKWESKVEG